MPQSERKRFDQRVVAGHSSIATAPANFFLLNVKQEENCRTCAHLVWSIPIGYKQARRGGGGGRFTVANEPPGDFKLCFYKIVSRARARNFACRRLPEPLRGRSRPNHTHSHSLPV